MLVTGLVRASLNQQTDRTLGRTMIGSFLLVFLLIFNVNKLHASEHVYTLSVVPQYTPLAIYQNWQPLLEHLQTETGLKFKVKTYNNFRQFLGALNRGEPDFSYLAPYHLVLAYRTQAYEPIIRDDSKQLVGLLMVRKDSPLQSVNELDGATIAFPSPNAFAASLYMRSWLRNKVGINFTPSYVGTHDNVYRHIVRGKVVAGSGVNTTLAHQPSGLQERLRVLYSVPGVESHPISVHPRISNDIRIKVQNAILKMLDSAKGRELLSAVQILEPVKANYQRDYSHLENLSLE